MLANYSATLSGAYRKLLHHKLARSLAKFFIIVFAYYYTARLGLMVPYKESIVTLLWLPTGIAVGAIMRLGNASMVAIFIAAYCVERSFNIPVITSLMIAFGNSLAPFATAYCLRYLKFNPALIKLSDITKLLVGATSGMLISASIGVFSLYIGHLIKADAVLRLWSVWWAGDSIGVLLALPLILNLHKKIFTITAKQALQLLAWAIVFASFELLISAIVPSLNKQFMLSIFLVLPMLIWASMNFGIVGGSLLVISLSTFVVWANIHGFGAFYTANAGEGIFSIWFFIVTLVLTMLLISALQSERLLAKEAAFHSEKKLRAVVNGALDGIVTVDEKGYITEFNPAAERIFGYQKVQVIGKPLGEMIVPPNKRDAHTKGHLTFVKSGVKHIFDRRLELTAMRADGTEFDAELTITSVDEAGLPQVTGFIRDITQQKKAQRDIENLAYYDALTGLPNRRLLTDRFNQAAINAKRMNTSCALIFIDLDHFKLLNDTRGHDVGDMLLKEVAARLQNAVRAGDTVARLSGDEFVLIIESFDGDINVAYQQASELAQKLLAILNKSYLLDMYEFNSSASLGIVILNADNSFVVNNKAGNDAGSLPSDNKHRLHFEDLLRLADTAMYQAKAAGRNTFCFYDASTQQNVERHFRVESALHYALQNNEFCMHYQSIVDANQQIIGAETLIRWTHPILGNIGPAEFIPIAEKNNLIIKIGYWVLSQACAQLKAWQTTPALSQLRLSVNISAKQFLAINFVQEVRDLMDSTQIDPDLLKLELTETAVIDNIEDVIVKMKTLRSMGVRIVLDDFGMGQSSLVYLKRLPISMIKIDQSFVQDMLTDANDAAIVQMIIAIGETLQCSIVAEGVEELAQFELLKTYGCPFFQGYYFSKPLPLNAFEALINNAT